MSSEFGFNNHQMRTPFLVKNAWVFEIVGGKLEEVVLAHGDIDSDDVILLTESGRKFFVFGEEQPNTGWFAQIWANSFDMLEAEFEKFARIVIENGDFTITGRR